MKLSDMPPHARVWIFQSPLRLSGEEQALVRTEIGHFLQNWSSHGASMESAYDIIDDHFLVVAADEAKAAASGCGIDKLIRKVQEISGNIGKDLLDRRMTAFRKEGATELIPIHEFWAMRKAGLIEDQTLVYDNLVPTVEAFFSRWIVPFGQSWHAEMWSR